MMNKNYFLFILLSVFYSCKSGDKIVFVEEPVLNNIFIELPDTSFFLPQYDSMVKSTVYTKNGQYFIAFYNRSINSIDIIDVKEKKAIKQIPLHADGPNAIGKLPTAFRFYKEAFLFTTSNGYYLVNDEGEVIQKRYMPLFEEVQKEEYSYEKPPFQTFSFFTSFPLDTQKGTIAIPLYPKNTNQQPINKPFLVKLLSFETGEVETIEIPYPEEFTGKAEWGILNDLHICFSNDLLITHFAGSSDIYLYNYINKEITKKSIPSNLIKNKLLSGTEEGNGGSLTAGYYFDLQYDPYRNVYLRLQMGPADYLFSLKRVFSITQIAPDFNSWKEIKLPGDGSHYLTLLPVESGIWIEDCTPPENEEILTLWEIPL